MAAISAMLALCGAIVVVACATDAGISGESGDVEDDASVPRRKRDSGGSSEDEWQGRRPASPSETNPVAEPGDDESDDDLLPEIDPVDASRPVSIDFTCARRGSAAGGALVINELDYDQPGPDDAEFVEIYNPSATSRVDLAGYELVFFNGAEPGPRKDYLHLRLKGAIAPNGYLVFADPAVRVAIGATVIPLSASQSIQNGPNDAVAIMKDGFVVDSVSYGGSLAAPCELFEGVGPMRAVDSNDSHGSLIRTPNGIDTGNSDSDFRFTTSVTPGAANILR